MSYNLVPYLVDLDALRRAVGSRDEALLAAVIAADPDEFAGANAEDEQDEDDELSLSEALRQLVMGEPADVESAHQYGYALEHLCRHLGRALPWDCWEGIRWAVTEQTGVAEALTSGPPVPLPKIDNFPTIGHLPADTAKAMLARQGDDPLNTAAPSGRRPRLSFTSRILGLLTPPVMRRPPLTDDDVRELLDQYEGWLRASAEQGLGLVLFYY